jgi:chorismate mutase-like protein
MQLARFFAVGFILVWALVPAIDGADSPEKSDPLAPLTDAIDARLQVATLVARSKLETGAPVLDPVREKAVLDGIRQEAARRGFSADDAVGFFTHQIRASRLWQEHCLWLWRKGQPVPEGPVPDLVRDVRPQMDKATVVLLQCWAAWQKHHRQPRLDAVSAGGVRNRLLEKGYPVEVADAAVGWSAEPAATSPR